MKTEFIVVKATLDFKDRVKKGAARDNRTLSGYVTDLLLKDLKEKGIYGTDKDTGK